MNDSDESPSDELLEDLLTPFRAVSVPNDVHIANREAMHIALARRRQPPWWRRTVAVPIPAAVAAMATIALALAALLWPSRGPQWVGRERIEPVQVRVIETGPSDELARPAWSVTRTYLQSLEPLAKVKTPLDSHAKEQRDES
jgi:hypothetical protein